MALKSTILKAHLNISDMDRHVYTDKSLTIAQHPSENEQRLMVRLLAYILQYNEELTFTKGLCVDDEPAAWQKNLTDDVELWVDIGLPDEKRLKKAAVRAKQVVLYTYGENTQEIWWKKNQSAANQYSNLSVFSLPYSATSQMTELFARSMDLTATIQDGEIWLSNSEHSVQITPQQLK
ncbi:YaeQ family protein [Pseudoalteromonas luteoviolacea]|uniref:YaeQ family protein n=1 Tax=Pseudoalteromonas luteoviolacea TaxID=43657 RepID=UPI00114FEB34|nr:YaeQ family protein [Pseudoalteromonas luteoviolacea]TQF72494.1 YaeQ family protein [Pseudoalteromonas luteoviolacea]